MFIILEEKTEEAKAPLPQMNAGGFGIFNKLGYAPPPPGDAQGAQEAGMFNSPFFKAMMEQVGNYQFN